MSALTEALTTAMNTLLRSGAEIPAADLRAFEAQVISAVATLEARARGNTIHYTQGVPPNDLGLEGDLGVNETTGDFYRFTGGAFHFLFNGQGKASVFVPVAANAYGLHPAFNTQMEWNIWLTQRSATVPVPVTPQPTITSFAPTTGARGSTVVLTGTNFTGATVVSINSGAVASFVVNSATQITAVLSNSQTTGKVRVAVPGVGTAVSTSDFTVVSGSTVIVTPVAANLQNNSQDLTFASTGKVYSALAVLEADTDATGLLLQLNSSLLHNFGGALPTSEASVSIFVNGVYTAAPVPTASNVDQDLSVVLPGSGSRRVRVVYSTLSRANDTGDIESTQIKRLSFTGGTFATLVTPVKKPNAVAMLVDSKGVGIGTDVPGRDSYVSILRGRFGTTTDISTLSSYGGKRGLTAFGTQDGIEAIIADLHKVFDSTTTQRLFIDLSFNDMLAGTSAADLATATGNLVDAARAAFPSLIIVLGTPVISANNEATLPAFRTALTALRTTPRLAYLNIFDGLPVLTTADLVDGTHPGNGGNLKQANALEKTALFNSIWQDLPFSFADSNTVFANNNYSTTSTDAAFGHRRLANQFAAADKYISLQMQYVNANNRNAALGLHSAPIRVSLQQMQYSMYVDDAGKVIWGWVNPATQAYEVLGNTATAIPGYYYVLNRNTDTNQVTVLSGPDKLHPEDYTSVYTPLGAPTYITGALYPVLDIKGVAGVRLSNVQVDSGGLTVLSAEGTAPPYTGAVAPAFIEETETDTNKLAKTGSWQPYTDGSHHGGGGMYLGPGNGGTITLRGRARRFALWSDTYDNPQKYAIALTINGVATTANQRQPNPNPATPDESWAYYTSPLTALQDYVVVITIPSDHGTTYPGFDGIEWLDS